MKQAVADFPGVQLDEQTRITDLEYADDVVVLGDNMIDIQQLLDRIYNSSSKIGMEINVGKTKYFTSCISGNSLALSIRGQPIEMVHSFKYLGSIILPNGQAYKEVDNRIAHARSAFVRLKKTLWERREISLKTKSRVYQAAIRPVLLYGCETWPLRKEDIRHLEAFDHWCMRRILRVSWRDRISNVEVRKRCCDIPPLSITVQHRRLQWLGHLLRKNHSELSRQSLFSSANPGWKCRCGGQTKTWLKTIKSDVDQLGLHFVYGVRYWNHKWLEICADLASNRQAWTAAVRDISGAGSSSNRRQPP